MARKKAQTPVPTGKGHAVGPVAPSALEIAATRAAAFDTLDSLAKDAMPDNTRRALAGALRYWSLWHRAALGEELPLLLSPRQPLPVETVLIFIAHHTAHATPTGVRTGMPAAVRTRFEALADSEGVPVGKRRVAARAERFGEARTVAEDVPALKTLQQRVSLLGKLHTLAKVPRPQEQDGRIKAALRDASKSTAQKVRVALPDRRAALRGDDFGKLLAACEADPVAWVGIRDRAMLLCAYAGGGRRRSELGAMTFERIERSQAELPDGRVVPAIRWSLPSMKRRTAETADGEVMATKLVGKAVAALEAWLEVLRAEGVASGRVWRRIYRVRQKHAGQKRGESTGQPNVVWAIGAALKDEALWEIVKRRSQEAGLDPRALGAHSVRATFATDMLVAGLGELAIMQMTGHRSVASLEPYDRREVDDNPVLAKLIDG